jgi:hypothetical protein
VAIPAFTIISAVRFTLMDAAAATWSDAVLLADLNSAERKVCMLKPEAYPVRATISMIAGSKQTLPAGGIAIMDIYANVSSGQTIRLVDRDLMDEAARFWPVATPEQDVQDWAADPRDPTRWDVLPPNDGTGQVEALYGAIPTPIAETIDPINLADVYESVLKCFVLAEAYAHNSKRQDIGKSQFYEAQGMQMLGIKSQSQVAVAPQVG